MGSSVLPWWAAQQQGRDTPLPQTAGAQRTLLMVLESSCQGRKGAFSGKGVLAERSGWVEMVKLHGTQPLRASPSPMRAQNAHLRGYFKGGWSLEDGC